MLNRSVQERKSNKLNNEASRSENPTKEIKMMQNTLQTIENEDYLPIVKQVLEIEGQAVLEQVNNVSDAINDAIKLILKCQGKVIITGIGKSGIIGRKISATLASTGTSSFFLHPAEGVHGDLGMVENDDIVIAISNSGESSEILHMLPSLKQIGVKIISMVSNPKSSLGKVSTIVIPINKASEACSLGLAPTTSTTVTLALGDAIAMALLRARNFGPEDFAIYHPSGTLGNRLLLRVGELVERRTIKPVVSKRDTVKDAIFTMTKHGSGAISVVDDHNKFMGIITDGDIRRAFAHTDDVLNLNVSDLCNYHPVTIKYDALASDVLKLMKDKKVSVIPVLDDLNHPISMLHIQSLMELGL